MAKNISVNQWFKDIADNIYLNTAVINNILFVEVINNSKSFVAENTTIASIRNPKLFQKDFYGNISNPFGHAIKIENSVLKTGTALSNNGVALTFLALKNKQLETDFYSPEQLAEMYPDNPAYQVATADLLNDDIPDKVKSEPTIASEVSNNVEPS